METIVLTGASRGIGAATAESLARPGRRLILVARGAEALEAQCEEVRRAGAEAIARPCDLSDVEAVNELARSTGPVHGLVLNAGIANDQPFLAGSEAAAQLELQLNYMAPSLLLRAYLPEMKARGSGRVVAVGSLTSFVPFPGNATYAASKAALFTLIRSLRLELAGSGVYLGVVLPGYTETDMTKHLATRAPSMSAEAVGRMVAQSYELRRSVVVPGVVNRMAARVFGAFPGLSDSVLARFGRSLLPSRVDA